MKSTDDICDQDAEPAQQGTYSSSGTQLPQHFTSFCRRATKVKIGPATPEETQAARRDFSEDDMEWIVTVHDKQGNPGGKGPRPGR